MNLTAKNKAVTEAQKVLRRAGLKIEKLGKVNEASLNGFKISVTDEKITASNAALHRTKTWDVSGDIEKKFKLALAWCDGEYTKS